MDQKKAFWDTLVLAEAHDMPMMEGSPLGFSHLIDMYAKIVTGNFPEDKLGR